MGLVGGTNHSSVCIRPLTAQVASIEEETEVLGEQYNAWRSAYISMGEGAAKLTAASVKTSEMIDIGRCREPCGFCLVVF